MKLMTILLGCAFATIFFLPASQAETNWTAFTLTDNFENATGVCAADFDGDGDADIFAGSTTAGVQYWENIDGSGQNWILRVTLPTFPTSTDLHPADMDTDGDLDLLMLKFDTESIIWWENPDAGDLWTPHFVTAGFMQAREIGAVDLDGDGDMDVIGAGGWEVRWWNNYYGDGLSWTSDVIRGGIHHINTVDAADIDGDGDNDVAFSDHGLTALRWMENFNETNWYQHSIGSPLYDIIQIRAADMDGDGDIDLVGASETEDLVWFENTGGNDDSWIQHVVDDVTMLANLFTIDLDGDGDMDLLGSQNLHGFYWWENTSGNGAIWQRWTIDDSLVTCNGLYPADFDGDGDLDVVGASDYNNTVTIWFQSLDPIEITLVPNAWPVYVWPGAPFTYSAHLVSNLEQPTSVIVWTEAVLPDGSVFGPIAQTPPMPFTPETDITVPEIYQFVPGNAPVGDYTFRMKAGTDPQNVLGEDEFPIVVFEYDNLPDANLNWESPNLESAFADQLESAIERKNETRATAFLAAFPNPFNAATTVTINLPDISELTIAVYNIAGQRVATLADGHVSPGSHSYTFDASALASGLYFVHTVVPDQMNEVQKVLLVR